MMERLDSNTLLLNQLHGMRMYIYQMTNSRNMSENLNSIENELNERIMELK